MKWVSECGTAHNCRRCLRKWPNSKRRICASHTHTLPPNHIQGVKLLRAQAHKSKNNLRKAISSSNKRTFRPRVRKQFANALHIIYGNACETGQVGSSRSDYGVWLWRLECYCLQYEPLSLSLPYCTQIALRTYECQCDIVIFICNALTAIGLGTWMKGSNIHLAYSVQNCTKSTTSSFQFELRRTHTHTHIYITLYLYSLYSLYLYRYTMPPFDRPSWYHESWLSWSARTPAFANLQRSHAIMCINGCSVFCTLLYTKTKYCAVDLVPVLVSPHSSHFILCGECVATTTTTATTAATVAEWI